MKYLKYAIGEIILVVFGILIALQINIWNETRKERNLEKKILQSLQYDLKTDMEEITWQMDERNKMLEDYSICLDILSNRKNGTVEDFRKHFESVLIVGGVSLNKTTFNNLQTSGQLSLIQNRVLSDSIVKYYNSDFLGWETAMRDYTRNIVAPFLMEFDYMPQSYQPGFDQNLFEKRNDLSDYKREPKTLEDYKREYFIINVLRQKIFNLEGLIIQYKELLESARGLDNRINEYLMNDSPS